MPRNWIPRLAHEQMPAALADYLAPRVKRLGYLGEMFQVGGNAPEVLLTFMKFTDSLKDALPFDVGETVVLTVAVSMRNDYERNQHERLCIRSGMSRDWIVAVQRLTPERAVAMTPAQRAAQRFTLQALATNGGGSADAFDALAEFFTPGQAISIGFLVGRYLTHALLANTLRLQPPVPSIFDDTFTA